MLRARFLLPFEGPDRRCELLHSGLGSSQEFPSLHARCVSCVVQANDVVGARGHDDNRREPLEGCVRRAKCVLPHHEPDMISYWTLLWTSSRSNAARDAKSSGSTHRRISASLLPRKPPVRALRCLRYRGSTALQTAVGEHRDLLPLQQRLRRHLSLRDPPRSKRSRTVRLSRGLCYSQLTIDSSTVSVVQVFVPVPPSKESLALATSSAESIVSSPASP